MKLKMYPGYMNEDRGMVCAIIFPRRSTDPVTQCEITPGQESLVAECYLGDGVAWYSFPHNRQLTTKAGWDYLAALMHTNNIYWQIEVSAQELRAAGLDEEGNLLSVRELAKLRLDNRGDPLAWKTAKERLTPASTQRHSARPRSGSARAAVAVLAAYRTHNVLWTVRDRLAESNPSGGSTTRSERWLTACRELEDSMDRLLARADNYTVRLADVDRLRVRTFGLIMLADKLQSTASDNPSALSPATRDAPANQLL